MTQDGDGTTTRHFRALLANVADMVTISDRDGSIIYASPATRNVSGYTPQEFMRRNPFDLIYPEDRLRCDEALARLVENSGLSLELEHRVRHKDGGWLWVEGTFTSLFDDPDVGGLLATVRDITGRKEAEASLQKSEERQALLLKLSDALRTGGDPIELQETAALHAESSRSRGGLDFEFRLNHPVKGERWILSRSRHVAADGEAGRLVGIAFDITERKRLESERARLRVREAAMRAETAERERISRELHDRVAHPTRQARPTT
jgi:PAS domain S-box-containing protein